MKQILPVEESARDDRLMKMKVEALIFDSRDASAASQKDRPSGFKPTAAS